MKKFSRLFLSGMLVTILSFGLAGCGSQKNSKDTASSSHTKTEKVTILLRRQAQLAIVLTQRHHHNPALRPLIVMSIITVKNN